MPLDTTVLPEIPMSAAANAEIPIKRKRGRPRKNPEAPPRIVRESLPRTKHVPACRVPLAPVPEPLSNERLKGMLLATHHVAALAFHAPEFALDDAEASELASAIQDVLREYELALTGKAAAVIGIMGVIAMLYLPRMVLIKERLAREKIERNRPRLVPASPPDAAL